MSNKPDWSAVIIKLMQKHEDGPATFFVEVEAELHNAFVAGQESVDCSVDELPEAHAEVEAMRDVVVGFLKTAMRRSKGWSVDTTWREIHRAIEYAFDSMTDSPPEDTSQPVTMEDVGELRLVKRLEDLEETVRQEALVTRADRQTRDLQRPLKPIEAKVLEMVQRLEDEITKMDGRINRLTGDVTNADISIKNQSKKICELVDQQKRLSRLETRLNKLVKQVEDSRHPENKKS